MLSGAPLIAQGDGDMLFYQCKVCQHAYRGVTGCPQCRQNMNFLESETKRDRLEFVQKFVTKNVIGYKEFDCDEDDCIADSIRLFDKIEKACK